MYQMSGTRRVKCMSFESSGLPLAVWLPAITQLFDPTAQPSQGASPSRAITRGDGSEMASVASKGTRLVSLFSSSSSFL